MKWLIYLLAPFVYLTLPSSILASEVNQFVTIVNPVRISQYTPNSLASLSSQYSVINNKNLPATWLITYDVLNNPVLIDAIKGFDSNQEIGLFFEISPYFAGEANVTYNDAGSWHHAKSLFLSGYRQEERIRFIDTLFVKFKDTFGYYPTSVGAWWIDSFSLFYMQEKYGIMANLGLADQYATDGYQVWGTYWSTPFYPSKNHAGIPASGVSTKIDVVTLQWAPRDPLNGYFNSYFSTQDYLQSPVNRDTDYFEKLVRLYASKNGNSFGQIVVGLEGDLSAEAYEGEYRKQIEVIKRLSDSGDIKAVTMSEFGDWYRNNFLDLSPPQIVETDDLLGKPINVVWYQSPHYRIGLTHNYETLETRIFDFRSYHSNFQDPYFLSPNKEFELSIYIPSYFDESNYKEDVWVLKLGVMKELLKEDGSLKLTFDSGVVFLSPKQVEISGYSGEIPKALIHSPSIDYSQKLTHITFKPKENFIIADDGYVFRDLTDVATRVLMRKRTLGIIAIFSIIFIFMGFRVIFSNISLRKKLLLLTLIIVFPTFFIAKWYKENTMYYYVSQAEVDALLHLSFQPRGSVLVFDKECLGCSWETPEKPAAFSNKRAYVQKWGKHPIVYNRSVFEAQNQEIAREEFEKVKTKYIYITKYGDYIEKVPFSPGDLNIEKIYDNANAEVWRLKEN